MDQSESLHLSARVQDSPQSRFSFVGGGISFVQAGDFGDKRIIGIRISEERTNGEKKFSDGQGGCPSGFQYIQTDTAG